MHSILPEAKNPVLRTISRPLSVPDIKSAKTKKLIAEMKKLLDKEHFGVALAAVQVGEPVRLFIVSGRALLRQAQDKSPRHPKSDYVDNELPTDSSRAESRDQVFINPILTKLSRKKTEKHEGCLSIRGKWGEVPRAEKATLQYTDEEGRITTRGASGFLAHIFQHEMDHLEGILYTDKATSLYDDPEKPRGHGAGRSDDE